MTTELRPTFEQPLKSPEQTQSIFATNLMDSFAAGLFYAPVDGETSAVDQAASGTKQ
jgi:hypothetical protein